jgi:hypothetical protein
MTSVTIDRGGNMKSPPCIFVLEANIIVSL